MLNISILKNALIKNQPTLLVAGGLTSMVVGSVLLARAHKKANFEPFKEEIEDIQDGIEDAMSRGVPVTSREAGAAVMPVLTEAAVYAAKKYAVPVSLTVFGIGMVLSGHRINLKRIEALGSALVAVQAAFTEYRGRVKELPDGEKTDDIVMGREPKNDGEKFSPLMYNRVFDSTNRHWGPDRDLNMFYLGAVESHLNDMLQIRRTLPLNTAYEALGFPVTPYGQIVGWTVLPGLEVDGYIDLGITEIGSNSWQITPNVDGPILDLIGM